MKGFIQQDPNKLIESEIDFLEKQIEAFKNRIGELKKTLPRDLYNLSSDVVRRMFNLTGLHWKYDENTNSIKSELLTETAQELVEYLNKYEQMNSQMIPIPNLASAHTPSIVSIDFDKAEKWTEIIPKNLETKGMHNFLLEEIQGIIRPIEQKQKLKR